MAFPVDKSRIDDEEVKLGKKLPALLRARLGRENGGELRAAGEVWWLHPVWDATDRRTIARTANHIARETESARGWAGFPEGAIAIAENGSGDRLILLDEEIHIWDHETGEATRLDDIDW
jgi:hypothetical protein